MVLQQTTKFTVAILHTADSYTCACDESLLKGMIKLGRKDIPVGCVNGGCGVCKVRIVNGTVNKIGPVSRAHVSAKEEAEGYTLACRVAPATAVSLEVVGRLVKPFLKQPAAAGPLPWGTSATHPTP